MSEREHFAGIIHRDHNDVIWFGDTPVRDAAALPRHKSWAGTLWYSDATVRPGDIAKLLGPTDEAGGPKPGSLLRAKIRIGPGRVYRIVTGDSWGIHRRDPEVADREIREMRTLAVASGMQVKASAAATALNTYLDRWDGKDYNHPSVCQLPCQWRGLAQASFHGGPIAVLRGGAPFAVQIDVRRAYLDALYTPIPVLGMTPGGKTGGYQRVDNPHWDTVRKHEGFLDATVIVTSPANGLPPLPIKVAEGVIYPNGRFRGAWVIAQVRDAEARGDVVVEKIHQAAVARQLRPLFAEVADFFADLPDKLAKISYQRYWARWGNPGGYVGTVSAEPRVGEIPANGLWWRFDGVTTFDMDAPRTFRPDISAFIAALNHRRVMRVIHEDLKPDSIAAVHVDAIWTTDTEGAERVCRRSSGVGSWRVKREGPLRIWSPGCYDHAGDIAASGYDANEHGTPTRDRVEKWLQSGHGVNHRMIQHQRVWTQFPSESAEANSTAPTLDADTSLPVTEGPDINEPIWTRGGWIHPDYTPETPSWAAEQPTHPEENATT